MNLTDLPVKVRDSALALALAEKLSSLQPVTFDYWGQFQRLRGKVSADVAEITQLFPEFTPHDEELHLARLFGIADKLIGADRYRQMNAAELFLLACGLYAHDWGMAVGSAELIFLQSGAQGPVDPAVFTPLDDEATRLRQFAAQFGVTAATPGTAWLNDALVRLYIRRTHAWRSGVRARAFFLTAGSSVPQALELICQGHWLAFSDLDDEMRFSSHFSVLGYTVNLRAVALYVRLVDLFDIADDRTPYAVWRFVAPENPVSVMEWQKHRALSPVTFPPYDDGRCVRFDGWTADPEVWAELEDLRRYCEEQIAGSMDLLARHPDARHRLDLRKLNWRVTPERFKPVNIRFEFNRTRIFDILANEIYQGDSHVFLRELLQNSIDAITLRRELVCKRAAETGSQRDVGLGFDDAIYFKVTHGANGDAVVVCQDYGIGMDEYIIRNYLAVAGISYYHSDDFRHLGLQLDPISTFGIGILSCFMVASRIEISTRRDPLLGGPADALHIDIPAVDRQYRVFPGEAQRQIGTAVTVHVQGMKLKSDVQPGGTKPENKTLRLKVTEYLAAIAGFVEFPVVVDEDGKRTVILHPRRPATDAMQFAVQSAAPVVCQLASTYPWAAPFAPQDAPTAACRLQERSFDLAQTGIPGMEGWALYVQTPAPNDEFQREHDPGDYDTLELQSPKGQATRLRIKRFYNRRGEATGISPSSRRASHIAVFRKGILVADAIPARTESRFHMMGIPWPMPAIAVNFAKKLDGRLDVARRALLQSAATWDEPIWRMVCEQLRSGEVAEYLKLAPYERFRALAKLSVMFQLSEGDLAEIVPLDKWPLPALLPGAGAAFIDRPFAPGDKIMGVPAGLSRGLAGEFGGSKWSFVGENSSAYLKGWAGPECIAPKIESASRDYLDLWGWFSKWRLDMVLAPVQVHFVSNAYPGLPFLEQTEFVCTTPETVNEAEAWEQAMIDPLALSPAAKRTLRAHYWGRDMDPLQNAAPFAPPFDKFYYGSACINLRHPTGRALFRCAAAIRLHGITGRGDAAAIGRLGDLLNYAVVDPDHCAALWAEIERAKLLADFTAPPAITPDDYIPKAKNSEFMDKAMRPGSFKDGEKLEKVVPRFFRSFGLPLKSTEPEETPPEIVACVKSLKKKQY